MFKILDEACTPTRGTKYSAAVDLRAKEDITIAAGETVLVPLGVKIDLDSLCVEFEDKQFKENYLNSHYLQLMLRSGLGKKGLILPNGVGVIDLDYKDEIMMIVHNSISGFDEEFLPTGANYPIDRNTYEIKKGDRVGQITLLEHKSFMFDIESEDERTGGFGSTGK
jgi:dUTP pyrophosphatase